MYPEKRKGRNRRGSLSTAVAQKFNKYLRPKKCLDRAKSTTLDNGAKIYQDSVVLELDNTNYKDVIADTKKDVVVEFYDQEV
jgi:hypothetical protein